MDWLIVLLFLGLLLYMIKYMLLTETLTSTNEKPKCICKAPFPSKTSGRITHYYHHEGCRDPWPFCTCPVCDQKYDSSHDESCINKAKRVYCKNHCGRTFRVNINIGQPKVNLPAWDFCVVCQLWRCQLCFIRDKTCVGKKLCLRET